MSANVARIEDLSENNIDVEFDFPEHNDRSCQAVQYEKAAVKLVMLHEQLAKLVEPAVRDLGNPPTRFETDLLFQPKTGTIICLRANPLFTWLCER